MLTPIFTAEDIQQYMHDDYELNNINFSVKKTNILVKRAFTKLKENNIINDYNYLIQGENPVVYGGSESNNITTFYRNSTI